MKNKLLTITLGLTLAASMSLTAFADPAPDGMTAASETAAAADGKWEAWETAWETLKNDYTIPAITPGEDETKLNFAWYSVKGEVPELKIGKTEDLADAVSYQAVQNDAVTANETAYVSNKVTAMGLEPDTDYYYSYQKDGAFTEAKKIHTAKADSFSFIYVGDPQIGSSNELKGTFSSEDISEEEFQEKLNEFLSSQSASACNDSFNWNNTLNQAVAMDSEAAFILSAGDQVQTNASKSPNGDLATSEIEYTGVLSAEALANLPFAPTVGSHDSDNVNFSNHYNVPNASDTLGVTDAAGDYYFTYDNALFLFLNTQDTNVADHKEFIDAACAENPDVTWKFVTLHQDIYGSAEHSNEPEITNLRYQLIPILEENDVDVVFTGHDHAYTRSYLMNGAKADESVWAEDYDAMEEKFEEEFEKEIDIDEPYVSEDQTYLAYLDSINDTANVAEGADAGTTVINPEGILYMTANSASGSKYYDLVSRQQSYVAAR
ncbi:MAG: metallophosphoesterase family protein [Candidatus Limivivens sp.]|nr:metallophosphoesterase family protein [Candidatus Limivivens sp.]